MPAENQTVPNDRSVQAFIDTLEDAQQRFDSAMLIDLMSEVSGQEPVMWGPAIIGFGSIHYRYDSGREGDMPAISFSPRKGKITLYLTGDAEQFMVDHPSLGKHKIGKGCIYINKLADANPVVLKALVSDAWQARTKVT